MRINKTMVAALVATGTLLSLSTLVFAEEYHYPPDEPRVSITFPDSWKVTPDENDVLHASPKDESIYFGFLPLAEDTTAEGIGGVIGEAIDSLVTDFKEGEDSTLEVNGIKLFTSDATGKDKESGAPVNISLAYFTPDENPKHMVALIYFGSDEAEKKHEKEISQVINSIKNPKKK